MAGRGLGLSAAGRSAPRGAARRMVASQGEESHPAADPSRRERPVRTIPSSTSLSLCHIVAAKAKQIELMNAEIAVKPSIFDEVLS